MATINLGTLRDYWKAVHDWVKRDPNAPVPLVESNNTAKILIKETIDFYGKKSGQTSKVPHRASQLGRTTFDPPSTFTGEFSDENYNSIYKQDGILKSTSQNVNNSYAQQLFSFNILSDLKLKGCIPQSWTANDLEMALKSIVVTWLGYGSGSDNGTVKYGATLKRWGNTTQSWLIGNTSNASVPAIITAIPNVPNDDKILDSNGNLHVLAHTIYASDGTIASIIYTDYIKVDVELEVPTISVSNPSTFNPITQSDRVEITSTRFALSTAPVQGAKTVTTTPAEIFAGSSRLANRYQMAIYNESTQIVYWGNSNVTTTNGFPLLPGDSVTIKFKNDVPIYAVAPTNAIVKVIELA